jgi:hypothetical protein
MDELAATAKHPCSAATSALTTCARPPLTLPTELNQVTHCHLREKGISMLLRLLTGIMIAVLSAGSVMADEITDKAKAAADLAAAGKFVEAIDALDSAQSLLWERSPLVFRRTLWVAKMPLGFGAYIARDTNVYTAGDQMIAYVEPVGFSWRKAGDGWQTDFSIDVSIKDKDGNEVYSRKNSQMLAISSHAQNREFIVHLSYTPTGLPAGEYTVATTLNDVVSGKSGTFSLPFVIR